MGASSGLEARRADGMDRMDKRVARTEKAIRAAFFKLLGDIDYEKISVSALAREAGVDRKTFYLHYRSIDALADEILRERARPSHEGAHRRTSCAGERARHGAVEDR